MMSLPDFKEKQLLFIKTERGVENKIKLWNSNIKFCKDGKAVNQMSCHKMFAIFIIGDISVTSKIIKECGKFAIPIYFLSENLNQYASINAVTEGNYLLRSIQYSANRESEILMSKKIVVSKISNQIRLLKEKKCAEFKKIEELKKKVEKIQTNQELLGLEGNASRIFFKNYFNDLNWKRRLPRTKCDIANTLLDIGYTYLFNFIDTLLNMYGFDTYKGFYHQLFFQRKSLVCDLMEPVRCVIDKSLLKAWNLGQIRESDFLTRDGQYKLKYENTAKYSEIFFNALMENKEQIYIFIRQYYKMIMSDGKDVPEFKIKTRGCRC